VKQDLTKLANQVVTAQLKAVIAKRQGNEAEAKRLAGEVEELRIPTIQLLAKANEEFKAKFIDPDIKLFGMKSAKVPNRYSKPQSGSRPWVKDRHIRNPREESTKLPMTSGAEWSKSQRRKSV
jgi:hypothetical protein